MTTANLIEIFCILDEFCKFFAPELKKHTIQVLESVIATVPAACPTVRL